MTPSQLSPTSDEQPLSISVRESRWDEADTTVVRALLRAYLLQTETEKREHGRAESSASLTTLAPRYEREVADPGAFYADCTTLVAAIGQRLVGVVIVRSDGGEAEIKRLWADPSLRGRGVGSALLDAALALTHGRVRLSVWDWRAPAMGLYESRGFERVLSWDDREGLVCMERAAHAGESVVIVEHSALSDSHVTALQRLFDREYRAEHGDWDPDRPYGYSPADVHTMIFRGDVAVAHVGYQRRVIRVGAREVRVAGTGGVLVHPDWRSDGVGRRVMSHAQQTMRDDDRVDFGYLGCRDEVVPFYERTGWSRVSAVESHVSITDATATVTSAAGPILVFPAMHAGDSDTGKDRWPSGDIDLRGTPW